MNQDGIDPGIDEGITNVLSMGDGRAKDDRFAGRSLFFPVLDDRFRDQALVENGGDFIHIEVHRRLADVFQGILDTHIDDESTRGDQMTGSDHLPQGDLVSHVRENITQSLAITAIGCGGQAADAGLWVACQHCIDHRPIARGRRVVGFVDHE